MVGTAQGSASAALLPMLLHQLLNNVQQLAQTYKQVIGAANVSHMLGTKASLRSAPRN